MKTMGLNEIREEFLKFFECKDHLRLESASLVPINDNSLLLINSGMAPLKPYFTGQETPPSKRIATCQKCIRTGDIENVGKTARHGTFFEMLGDFSFGDYFKEEIIDWSWEFCTKVMAIPQELIYVSVYQDDDEAYNIWHEKIGLGHDRIFRMGKEDNFWEHGLGPCGPCSELYFDRGQQYGCGSESCTVGCDCDRYMEFWNLVFTQFNKEKDGSYTDLANPNIDTGMGLERMATIMQNVDSIFDVDTIKALRDAVCDVAKVEYKKDNSTDVSVRVIVDHIRSVTFMTSDGVLPSNEGRGYVLRRLLRRAARHGKLLGIEKAFLANLCKVVIAVSKDAYPQLKEKQDYILKVLTVEENSFYKTIDKGMDILNGYIGEMKEMNEKIMKGEKSFKLYDTYGFPIDLTKEILEEQGFGLDEEEFASEMKIQKERARAARSESTYMGAKETIYHKLDPKITTDFAGHNVLELKGSKVIALISNNEVSQNASAGDEVSILLDKTPFYAESGGQIGDAGVIETDTGKVLISDCVKVIGGRIAHIGTVVDGSIGMSDTVNAKIDVKSRVSITRNHSATHLLQKALRNILGSHVEQAGSLVTMDRLRFDFTHFQPMTELEIGMVEQIVNEKIMDGLNVNIKEMSIDAARKEGAMALFGEKYGETVRVVNMDGFSIELCGGAHIDNTAKIGSFKIVSESGIAAGVRRIEALTGIGALDYYKEQENTIKEVCTILKTKPDNLKYKAEQILQTEKDLSKEVESLKSKMAGSAVEDVISSKEVIKGVNVVAFEVSDADSNTLKTLGDEIKNKLGSGIIILASGKDDKVNLLVMATDDCIKLGAHSGNIIKAAAAVCGGGGGGRPNMAQAGGKEVSKIKEAIAKAKEVALENIGN